ncbi:MAG: hypothetical protein R3266_03235 [Gemmatimonadota bacterium]|nr:hypothetical protein [Gemmatimonadota bacterium]
MILPEVRASFSRDDAQRLVYLLERSGEDRAALEREASERGIDPLLDHPALAEVLLEGPAISRLPLSLVSYVLLRRSLLDAGVDSRLLADYVTSLFLRFADTSRAYRVTGIDDDEVHYLVDILAEMSDSQGRRGFLLRAHLGNFSLWIAGLFPDWVTHRVHRKGGPDLSYYEEMGQTGFALAAEDPFARRERLDALYRDAARAFVPMRRALNAFSDRYLTPAAASPDDRLLRQVSDAFDDDWLQA